MRLGACLIAIAACHPTFPENAPSLKITDAAFGAQHSKRTVPYAMPFELDPTGSNGTALVLAYLHGAEDAGARYVSDLAIALQFTYRGKPMECVSHVALEHLTPVPAPGPPAAPIEPFTTMVTPWRPDEVKAAVTDRDLACTKHGQHVMSVEPDFETRYDVTVPRKLQPGYMPTHEEMTIVWTDECVLVDNHHIVRRYAHFIATKFTPPDWARITREFSDWKLIEQPPECHTFERVAGAPLHQAIRGTIHFTGENGKAKYPLSWNKTDDNWVPCLTPTAC